MKRAQRFAELCAINPSRRCVARLVHLSRAVFVSETYRECFGAAFVASVPQMVSRVTFVKAFTSSWGTQWFERACGRSSVDFVFETRRR